jgi:hypothetical protein
MIFFRKKKEKFSLGFIAFLQALGLVIYCGLIGVLFWQGNNLFGPPYTFLGPAMFLVLFVVSAMISALIVLGYPFILFWEKKRAVEALKLAIYTAAWLAFFTILLIFILAIF